jgi:hypothetical protein
MIVSSGRLLPSTRPTMLCEDDRRAFHLEVCRKGGAVQDYGLELARLCLLLQRLEIQARALEQLDGNITLDPASIFGCSAAGLSRPMSNVVDRAEFFTVAQPYAAGAVSCTIRMPARPGAPASSYL